VVSRGQAFSVPAWKGAVAQLGASKKFTKPRWRSF